MLSDENVWRKLKKKKSEVLLKEMLVRIIYITCSHMISRNDATSDHNLHHTFSANLKLPVIPCHYLKLLKDTTKYYSSTINIVILGRVLIICFSVILVGSHLLERRP